MQEEEVLLRLSGTVQQSESDLLTVYLLYRLERGDRVVSASYSLTDNDASRNIQYSRHAMEVLLCILIDSLP